jgi:hypothetical protein
LGVYALKVLDNLIGFFLLCCGHISTASYKDQASGA